MAKVQKPIVPSRLYRYRAFTRGPEAVQQEIAAILQNYLYCAEFTRMNDPMEGFYRSGRDIRAETEYQRIVAEVLENKRRLGIACFTETYENTLMWAHYAGNYSGICVGYSSRALIESLPGSASVVRLAYVDRPPRISLRRANNPTTAAIRVLSQKRYNWAYEREWRVLTSLGQVPLEGVQPVRSIHLGSRIDPNHREAILRSIQGTNIRAYMMEVDGYDHTFVPINRPAY